MNSKLREIGRRWKWIFRHGRPEPMAAFLIFTLTMSGMSLLFHADHARATPLLFPLFFGYALVFLGLLGIVGVSLRNAPCIGAFAFFAGIIRVWMALLYFMENSRDLTWISLGGGALALFWILSRVVCEATSRAVWRSRIGKQRARRAQ